MRVLFLDFDGVLHPLVEPDEAVTHFLWLHVLADLLAPWGDVRVAVHSTWRYMYTDEELRELLGVLGPLFIGTMPRSPRAQAISWFPHANPAIADHLVLDDAPHDFPADFAGNLVLCAPLAGHLCPRSPGASCGVAGRADIVKTPSPCRRARPTDSPARGRPMRLGFGQCFTPHPNLKPSKKAAAVKPLSKTSPSLHAQLRFLSSWRFMHMQQSYKRRPGLGGVDKGIRKVARTFGKTAFLTHGPKSRGTLLVESDAERLVSHLLGFDPAARNYAPQPFTIDLVDGTVLRTPEQLKAARAKHKGRQSPCIFYTPDFLVTWSGGTNEALEVKLDQYMGGPDYEEKLRLAAEILWAHGYRFSQVVLPNYWKHPLRMNIPLLHQAAMRKDLCPDQDMFAQIEQLADAGAQTVSDYCAGLSVSPSLVPVLLAFGALQMDLVQHPIAGNAPVTPAFGALDHLELVRRLAQ